MADGDGRAALRILRAGWPRDRDAIGWRIWNELVSGMAFELTEQQDSAAVRYGRAADERLLVIPALTRNRIYLPVALRRLAAIEAAGGG